MTRLLILMGELPFPKQKQRKNGLGGGNRGSVWERDCEEKRKNKMQLGCKISK